MKAILGFTRMSVRGLNKVKRELGFVLMALNIRKVVAQRAENNQKFIKRQFLYYFNRNCLFSLIKNFMSRTHFCFGISIVYRYHIKEFISKQSLTMSVTKMIDDLNFEVDKVITLDIFVIFVIFCNFDVFVIYM